MAAAESRPCPRVTPWTRAWYKRAGSSSQGAPLCGRGRSVSEFPPDASGAPGEILSPSAPLPALSPPPSPAAGCAITPGVPGDGKGVLKPDRPCGRAHGSGSRLLQTPAWAGGSGAGGTGRFAERFPAAPAAFPRHPGGTQELLPTPRPPCQGWRLWAAALSHSLPVAQSPPATYPRAPR